MVAIPKPASTIILINGEGKVYLTKRPITMKFLGGFYVFPGGSVDASDYEWTSNRVKNVPAGLTFDTAYFIAAARELFEEVGILLVENMNLTLEEQWEYRLQLMKHEISFHDFLKKENLVLDLSSVSYIGHRVTPKTSKYRYDTRFFVTKLPEGQKPIPYEMEVEEAYWTSPEDALKAYRKGEITLVRPTKVSLETLHHYLNGTGPLQMPKKMYE